jgi:hypothetical protein
LIVHRHVLKQRRIVTKQIGDSSQPLRHGCANLRHRLEHADGVTRSGEQISDAMTHQAAADNAYFLPTHLCLPHSLLRGTSERPERWSTSSIRQGSKVMPYPIVDRVLV